jgi:uncharacterized membrane protein
MMRGFGLFDGGYGHLGGGFFMLLVPLFWFLVIAGVLVLIVTLIRRAHAPVRDAMHVEHTGGTLPTTTAGTVGLPGRDEAVAITRMRLATGEITKDQFDEIMKALG